MYNYQNLYQLGVIMTIRRAATTGIRIYKEAVGKQEQSDFAFIQDLRKGKSADLPGLMSYQDFMSVFITEYQELSQLVYDLVYRPDGNIHELDKIESRALRLLAKIAIDEAE
jgi:hypothetical protein